MIYKELHTLLKTEAEGLSYSVTFGHGRSSDFNIFLDESSAPLMGTEPFMWLFPMTSTAGFTNASYQLNQTFTVNIAIYKQDTQDSNTEQMRALIEEADMIATDYLIKLNESDPETGEILITNIVKTPFFKETAHVLTGVVLSVKIQVTDNYKYCCI